MKLMVIGNARHGKDSVCDILCREFGLKFESSSHFVAIKAVKPYLEARGVTYPDFASMYADRVNRRADWYDAITNYNIPDRTRLGRELFEVYDIYCGIRNREELKALQEARIIQYTFWVDASKRLPPEPATSMTITRECADHIIDNNGTFEALRYSVMDAYDAAQAAISLKW